MKMSLKKSDRLLKLEFGLSKFSMNEKPVMFANDMRNISSQVASLNCNRDNCLAARFVHSIINRNHV